MKFQPDFSGEDYSAFTCVGQDPHPCGGPTGVHGCGETLQSRLGDQTELTAGVVLDSQGDISYRDVLHQGDGFVGAHLGHKDGGCVVVMHAGAVVNGETIMLASSGTHLGLSVVEWDFTLDCRGRLGRACGMWIQLGQTLLSEMRTDMKLWVWRWRVHNGQH